MKMNHLIISAHPSEKSFSNYLAKILANEYEELGWIVNIRDLYKTGFNAVLTPSDLEMLKSGVTPIDIKAEQELVQQANLITVIYPLWWASFPAVLKGYIDRVFANGFAFKYGTNGATGLLQGKKVVIHTTMGNTVEEYEDKGLIEAFKKIQGDEVFGFCGMEILGHYFYPQITIANEEERDLFANKAIEVYSNLAAKNIVE
jgi:NAD(P)H dehydrogenase (quinone)